MDPIAYADSYLLALDTIMAHLCTATGHQEGRAGAGQVHRYYLPPAANVWAVWLGGGQDVSHTWGTNTQAAQLIMDCKILGRFLTIPDALAWAAKVVGALPLYRRANVEWLRLAPGGMPDPDAVAVQLANDTRATLLYEVPINCMAVFHTLERYPAT